MLHQREIAETLRRCGFSVTEDQLSRPTSAFICGLYEQCLDVFAFVTADTIESKTQKLIAKVRENKERSEEEYGGNIGGFVQEPTPSHSSYRLRVLVKYCHRLLQVCGFPDFNLVDLHKPDPARTQRILSAVVNYARYREELLKTRDEVADKLEGKIAQVKSSREQKEHLEKQIRQNNDRLESGGPNKISLKNLTAFIERMEEDIKRLKGLEAEYFAAREVYKSEKRQLVQTLQENEDIQTRKMEELDELKSLSGDNLRRLNDAIDDIRSNLQRKEADYEDLKRQCHNLAKTMEAVKQVDFKVNDSLALADEVARLDKREEEETRRTHSLESSLAESNRQTENIRRMLEKVVKQMAEDDENFKEMEKQQQKRIHDLAAKVKESQDQCLQKKLQALKIEEETAAIERSIQAKEEETSKILARFEVEKQNVLLESQRVGRLLLSIMKTSSERLKDVQLKVAN